MSPDQPPATILIAIRTGHHAEPAATFDRVVFEFSGPLPLLRIEYVKQLIADGSGLPVRIAGRAIVSVQLTPAWAHDDAGHATAPVRLSPKLPIVKEIVSAGDFEGVVTYGIGLGRKAVLRIMTLATPNRVVIDCGERLV